MLSSDCRLAEVQLCTGERTSGFQGNGEEGMGFKGAECVLSVQHTWCLG